MDTEEQWLPAAVPGYEVSDAGRVRSVTRYVGAHWQSGRPIRIAGQPMKLRHDDAGYQIVTLSYEGEKSTWFVHQLVALAFLGPCPDGLQVCHGNGANADNHATNLRYDTPHANRLDLVAHGRHPQASRELCPRRHPLVAPNLVPSNAARGTRTCLVCHRALSAARRAARRGVVLDLQSEADRRYVALTSAVEAAA